MINPIRIAARGLLASVFIGGGLNQLKAPAAIAPAVEAAEQQYGINLPVAAKDLVTFNGAAMVAGGAALALGIKPRTIATGLVASLVPTTIVGHPFWAIEDPHQKFEQQNSFFSNAAIIGGLLLVALNGDGRD